jgi:hypothetical protein
MKMKVKTFDELKEFIEIKAVEHQADDVDLFEWIESQVENEILLFAAVDGLVLKTIDLSLYLNNMSKTVDDFDNEVAWEEWSDKWFDEEVPDYQYEIKEEMWALAEKQKLPTQTQLIYEFWISTFWPESYVISYNKGNIALNAIGKIDVAKTMLTRGFDIDVIANIVKLTPEEIKEL